MPTNRFDAIIIGGGAAGLMCSAEAARGGREILLLEHNQRLGQKILISGGGRCNFTNIHTRPDHYLSSNPHFCRSALARYQPSDFIELVEKHGIRYHEKKLGQLFCDTSSRQIVEMLEAEARAAGVNVVTGAQVRDVQKPELFRIQTTTGDFQSKCLVVATGGLSFPKLGASDFGYRLAQQFGLKIVPPRPGLVPLIFDRNFPSLSGVSIDCSVKVDGVIFRENLLFTHRGMSGPAILQASNYVETGDGISIDLLPDSHRTSMFEQHRNDSRELQNVLCDYLPRRFVQECLEPVFPRQPIRQLSEGEVEKLASRLHGWRLWVKGDEGYGKAEVTLGGIDTTELSSKTFETTKVPGLFFIGEVLDVTGWLGGYNFQWAWASAVACGQALR